jgi:hypothetical protein
MAAPTTLKDLLATPYEASHVLSWVKPFLLAILVSGIAQRLVYSGWDGGTSTHASYAVQQSVVMAIKAVVFTGVFCWYAPQEVKNRTAVLTELFVLFSWYMAISFLIQTVFYYNTAYFLGGSLLPTVVAIAVAWGTLYAYRQVAEKKA